MVFNRTMRRTARWLVPLMALMMVIYIGICMASNKIIAEVFELEKPIGFASIPVDSIIQKYIPNGTEKNLAKKILIKQGFKVFEKKKLPPLDSCNECDEMVLSARYDHRPFFSIFYDYGITIQIGFRLGRVAVINASFVKNVY
jgi:hypothetical protein